MLIRQRHPERVSGLVLCATSARFSDDTSASPMVAAMAVSLRMVPSPLRRQLAASMTDYAARRWKVPPAMVEEVRRHDPAAIVEAAQAVRRFGATAWVADLNCPAVSIVTMNDGLVPAGIQLQLAHAVGATCTGSPVTTPCRGAIRGRSCRRSTSPVAPSRRGRRSRTPAPAVRPAERGGRSHIGFVSQASCSSHSRRRARRRSPTCPSADTSGSSRGQAAPPSPPPARLRDIYPVDIDEILARPVELTARAPPRPAIVLLQTLIPLPDSPARRWPHWPTPSNGWRCRPGCGCSARVMRPMACTASSPKRVRFFADVDGRTVLTAEAGPSITFGEGSMLLEGGRSRTAVVTRDALLIGSHPSTSSR